MSTRTLIASAAPSGTCTVQRPVVRLGDRVHAATDGGDAWGWVCRIEDEGVCLNCGHDRQLWVGWEAVVEVVEG